MEDDVITDVGDMTDAIRDVESEIQSLQAAVENIEKSVAAIERQPSFSTWFVLGAFMFLLGGDLIDTAWHSRFRYGTEYGVSTEKVQIAPQPRDCAFMTAPLGNKGCHYERSVDLQYWATSTTGQPIESSDGEHWMNFTPPQGVTIPTQKTLESVVVGWVKHTEP